MLPNFRFVNYAFIVHPLTNRFKLFQLTAAAVAVKETHILKCKIVFGIRI